MCYGCLVLRNQLRTGPKCVRVPDGRTIQGSCSTTPGDVLAFLAVIIDRAWRALAIVARPGVVRLQAVDINRASETAL